MAARIKSSGMLKPRGLIRKCLIISKLNRRIFHTSKSLKNAEESSSEVVVNLSGCSPLTLSTGQLAKFADGCAVVRFGDTSVMATAVGRSKPTPNSFVPLTVDYRQKAAAAGRIPTNHLRREMGPTEKEILTSRMIDRSLRPRFASGYCYETQISCNLLAVDGMNDPDILSINAASAALSLSNIPWDGPVAAVRVGIVDGSIVINPSRKQLSQSKMNLIITAASYKNIVMLEGNFEKLPEHTLAKALNEGIKETQSILKAISKLQISHGKPKRDLPLLLPTPELVSVAESLCATRVQEIFSDHSHNKISRDEALTVVRQETIEKLKENFPTIDGFLLTEAVNKIVKQVFRELIFSSEKRCDGRNLDNVRDISCQVDLFPPLHGSALFQRGQTQVLCTVAFDSPDSVLRSDAMSIITGGIKEKNFMLHYEFPPYATNETGRPGAASGRREMGHGALAEKSIRPVMPENFPFTVRLTSEVLESNGSSSMASVCGGSLALMDAGVPLSNAVAGVAIGLVSSPSPTKNGKLEKYSILTDILGIEDYFGDMDFKISGTGKSFTALQLDIKIPGIPVQVVTDSLQKARDGQNHILEIMKSAISCPRTERKNNWPVLEKFQVPAHKRARFVGTGGLNIKRLTAETGVQVTTVDECNFNLFAPNETAMYEAKEFIEVLLTEQKEPVLEFGAIYTARIEEIRENGVLVTLYPTMSPVLLHNSQLDQRKIHHPSALGLEVGNEISVKYYGRDPVTGVMRLSRKALQMLSPSLVSKNFSVDHSS